MNMSDSDTDLLPNNVLTFQGQGTTIFSAKGPNINSTNISSLSFRNNVTTSTMNIPWNMERPRYAESAYDQRSMYYRREREMSPMSVHSTSGMHMRNTHHSYYPGAMSSQRSMYGRSGSPASVRTIDSNTSMSAKDIAFAFQNGTFNKFEFKMIKDAYNRFMKSQSRKRVEKRRNVRQFLKGYRRKSGGDSGDQASDSSLSSSDDCRSTRTSITVNNKRNMSSCRSTKTDISDFRNTIRKSNMVRDCSENFRQNSFRSMSSRPMREKESRQDWPQRQTMTGSMTYTQNNRLKTGFLLPSQRFNQSVASMPILEKSNRLQRINEGNMLDIHSSIPNPIGRGRINPDADSDQEIFADVTVMEEAPDYNNGKRILEDDVPVPDKKRTKLSPSKNKPKSKTLKQNQTNEKLNDFVFAKPLPMKKPMIVKQQKVTKSSQLPKEVLPAQEKQATTQTVTSMPVGEPVEQVISSSQKVIEKLILKSSIPFDPLETNSENVDQSISQLKQQPLPCDTVNSTTDMSMRPSFIKRKLFTQKVDVAEKNSSSDSLQADSPQTNVYSKIQKEKNRARKLVTSLSCLNRDVQDDSNLLELIHKIVPADRMNVTTTTNKTEIQNIKSKRTSAEKWDVTSIIATCNNSDNVSDTFTDEDIFEGEIKDNPQNRKVKTLNNEKENSIKENKQYKNKPTETKKKTINKGAEKPAGEKSMSQKSTQVKMTKNKEETQKTSQHVVVVVEKLSPHYSKDATVASSISNSPNERNDVIKNNFCKGAKSFWDTDTESDIEATHTLTGFNATNSIINGASNPKLRAVPPNKNITTPIPKVTKNMPPNKAKDTLQMKNISNQNVNISSITKQKESKLNNKSKIPPNVTQTFNETNVDSNVNNIEVDKVPKNSKGNKKTLTSSSKENIPPQMESKKSVNSKSRIPPNVTQTFNDTNVDSNVNNIEVEKVLNNSKGNKKTLTSSLKEKNPPQTESKKSVNSKSRIPPNVTQTFNDTNVDRNVNNIEVEKVLNNSKGNKKTLTSFLKEKNPPQTESKKTVTTKSKTTLNVKTKEYELPQKIVKKTTVDQAKLKINNKHTSLDNNESQEIKINNPLRIRAQRKPKINDSCIEPVTSQESNNSTLSRSLRSREVDLTMSLKSNDAIQKKRVTKKNEPKNQTTNMTSNICKNNVEKTLPSDISFILETEPLNRTLRSKKLATANSKDSKPRQSEISFTLLENKSLNRTISTRSSRNKREIEALQNCSFISWKRSPLNKNNIAESRVMNRSSSRRLL